MAPVTGFATQLGIDTASTVTKRFDFMSESLTLKENLLIPAGLRGTRSRYVERLRTGTRVAEGQITLQPNVAELRLLLPWILGGSGTGSSPTTYPLADALTGRYVVVDRIQKVFSYNDVYVSKCTIRGTEGAPLDFTLDLIGFDETIGNAGTFPSLSIDTATTPFVFFDLALTIGGTVVKPKETTIVIDNGLITDRFLNSQILTALPPADRMVTLETALPYGDYSTVYGSGAAGVAATAVFTNGSDVLTLSFVKLAFPRESPQTQGRAEIMYPIVGTALRSGATLELVTTL